MNCKKQTSIFLVIIGICIDFTNSRMHSTLQYFQDVIMDSYKMINNWSYFIEGFKSHTFTEK